jgi:hypothetical protein
MTARDLKLVALLSAMACLFAMPLGLYLMSFQGQGLSGVVLGYVGVVVLAPYAVLHAWLGRGVSVLLLGMLFEFPWIMLWAGLGRWWYLRSAQREMGK